MPDPGRRRAALDGAAARHALRAQAGDLCGTRRPGYAAYQVHRACSDKAKRHLDLAQAGGIAQSLRALGSTSHGRIVPSLVALGLMAYGIYQLATARYRHMRAMHA